MPRALAMYARNARAQPWAVVIKDSNAADTWKVVKLNQLV
eukprot:SAG11_NODE_621_length_8169_cov_2.866914_2_plen_40_part_00